MTLVDEAKNENVKRGIYEITQEEIDLAMAWVRGDVSLKQASLAYGRRHGRKSTNGVYSLLARALKKHLKTK